MLYCTNAWQTERSAPNAVDACDACDATLLVSSA